MKFMLHEFLNSEQTAEDIPVHCQKQWLHCIEDAELSYVKSEHIRHERMYHEQLRDAYMYHRIR
jgi:hypothetical protein